MPILTNEEMDGIEQALGCKLPGLYRKLLVEIGCGQVGSEAEIYDPLTVYELYEPFFDDPAQLFHPYFPFGCQNRKQEMWIIDASLERAASIGHETLPEDWPEEEWLSYEQWIKTHLEPELGQTAGSE